MHSEMTNMDIDARSLLKEQGLRATAQRLAVLDTLHQRKAPMSHDEVMGKLGPGSYDKASVWRVLSDLMAVGIVRRMDLGDRVWRYELPMVVMLWQMSIRIFVRDLQ